MSAYTIRDIPETLWRKVKSEAALQGLTVKQFIFDALQEKIDREEEKRK